MSKTADQFRLYTSESSIRRPGALIGKMWHDLLHSRELAWRLFVRDISALYRQSILGIVWAFILPLANTVTWLFLRGSGIVTLQETAIPYPVFVFSGTMLWAIFMESLEAPLLKTSESKSLLTKINFPREAILLSGIYQSVFNAGIKVVLMILGLLALGYTAMNWTILLFPLAVLSLILAGTAIGLLITPIGMLYTDIGKGLRLVLQFFMFLTPVVFPVPKTGWVSSFISYNPLTPLIMTARDWLTGTPAEFFHGYLWVSLLLVVLLFIVWVIYRAAMPILIERMSA